jgi:hypothetical protein
MRILLCPNASSTRSSQARLSYVLLPPSSFTTLTSHQVGNLSETAADIRLSGDSILPEHCFFENSPEGKVVLHAIADSTTMVNGQRISPDKVSTESLRVGLRTDDVNRSRRN